MSRVFRLKSVQVLPVTLQEAWRFFSDPHQLLTITPPFLNLQVTNDIFKHEVYAGQLIMYTVRPLMGIPLTWVTEITHVEKEKMFVDEQRKGPYRLWHHQHHFKAVAGGVEMTDLVHYSLPLGWAGVLAHKTIVKQKLHQIFDYRFKKVEEIFGSLPGSSRQLLFS